MPCNLFQALTHNKQSNVLFWWFFFFFYMFMLLACLVSTDRELLDRHVSYRYKSHVIATLKQSNTVFLPDLSIFLISKNSRLVLLLFVTRLSTHTFARAIGQLPTICPLAFIVVAFVPNMQY